VEPLCLGHRGGGNLTINGNGNQPLVFRPDIRDLHRRHKAHLLCVHLVQKLWHQGVQADIPHDLFIVHVVFLTHNLHRELTQGLGLFLRFRAGPLAFDGLHLQIQEFCQLAGEGIAALFIAVPHFPDGFKISHLADNTGHFLQPGPRTTMMAAVARDNLIALAVLFRADGGGGHDAVFLDRPHQIVHRLIVLHLVGVFPERVERVELRHLQIDDFSLFHRAGRHLRRGRQLDFRRRDCRLLDGSGLARLYRLSGFRRRRTAGARFLALVGFLTSGHFVPNRGRSLLTGRLVNLRRAACAGLRRFHLFLRSRPGLLFRRTAPALRRLIRLRRFPVLGRSRSLLAALISGLDVRKVDYLAGRRGSVLTHTRDNRLLRHGRFRMSGGRLIPTRDSGPIGVFRRGRIARPGRSRSFRGFTFLRAHVYFFICHWLTSFFLR